MAEQFLTLMADLDDNSQAIMSELYSELQKEVVEEMKSLTEIFAPVPVHISHIGMFAGGKILFGAPDMNPPELLQLRQSIKTKTDEEFPWTPHATILMDEAETIQKALPIFVKSFHPFLGKITKLHLCAFWPTREILTVELN